MTTHTERTQAWLDDRFAVAVASGLEAGYAVRYQSDGRLGCMPVGHIIGLARACAVLNALATLQFDSCLDVGSGNGWLGHLVEQLFGTACVGVDLSHELALSARRDLGVSSYVANAAVLPFADKQFDLVLCSEVLEHVEHPVAVLGELWRVARRAVVVTTQEVCSSPWHRRLQMAAVERGKPHAERNYFLAEDFRRFFGDAVEIRALLHLPERIRLFSLATVAELRECLAELAGKPGNPRGSFGVLVVHRKLGGSVPARVAAPAVLDAVLMTDRRLDALGARRAADPLAAETPLALPPLTPAPVCPECEGALMVAGDRVDCTGCGAAFPVPQGVARLLGSQAAIAERESRWAAHSGLASLRRALQQRPLPWRLARRWLRWAIRVVGFFRLPLSWSDKVRIGWRFLLRG